MTNKITMSGLLTKIVIPRSELSIHKAACYIYGDVLPIGWLEICTVNGVTSTTIYTVYVTLHVKYVFM